MLVETLTDIFLFLSSDKNIITNKNIFDFNIFISNDFKINNKKIRINRNISFNQKETLENFLLDLLFYLYEKKILILNKKQKILIDSQISEKLKENYMNEFMIDNQNGKNSYQNIYKQKNINQIKIKKNTIKKQLKIFLENNEINFIIYPNDFIDFFNSSNGKKYRNSIINFNNYIQNLNINFNEDDNNKIFNENKSFDVEIKNDVKIINVDLNKNNNNNNEENGKENIKDDDDLSFISNNEILLKNKKEFLNCLNVIKNNVHSSKNNFNNIENNEKDKNNFNNKNNKNNNNSNNNNNNSNNNSNNKTKINNEDNLSSISEFTENENKNTRKHKKTKRNNNCGCLIF